LAERVADNTPDLFAELRARHRAAPLAALEAHAACFAEMADSPAAAARSFAYLLQDLTDPDLNARVRAQAYRTRNGLRLLVRDAVAAGALKPETNVAALARVIEAVLGGSLLVWAFYDDGPAARWLRRDLKEILRPHLAESRRPAPASRRRTPRKAR
jgi:hypothetical protein